MSRGIQAVLSPASRPALYEDALIPQCGGHFFSLIAHLRQRSSPHPFSSNSRASSPIRT